MRDDNVIFSDPRVWNVTEFVPGMKSGMIKLQMVGSCTFVSGRDEAGYEHVSISPVHKFRVPSWDDMCELKDIFFDDEEEVYQIHPPKSHYVNIQENCLHLWRPVNGKTLNDLAQE